MSTPIAVLAAIAVLGLHVSAWWFYVVDDAFISLRYAERLLAGSGLTWTDGERVEGYSNLLWVLLAAGGGLTGMDLLLAIRLVGLACGVATIALLGGRLGVHSASGAWVAGLSIAASVPIALWIPGGLEQPLVALCMAGALTSLGRALSQGPATIRAVLPAAGALSALCWTRPDAPILVAGLTLGWFLASGQNRASLRSAVALAGIPASAFFVQLLGRLAYYGDWVPNTAHVKVRPSEFHTDMGAIWTVRALDAHLPLLLLAITAFWGTLENETPRSRVRIALPVLGAWLAWTVWVGGDIFPAHRHFVPMVVVLAWLAGSGVAGLARRRPWVGPGLAVVATGMLGWMAHDQTTSLVHAQARAEAWVLDARDVGETLGRAFHDEQPLVAVSIAGAIPFASGLPALDMIGLNDRHIGRTESMHGGWVGHETGDGAYVFARRPDLVFFRGPRGGDHPTFKSEVELSERPDFRTDYALVQWQTVPHHAEEAVVLRPWLRRAGVLGPQVDADTVRVPAWLLTEHGGTATPDPDGRLTLRLNAGETAGGSVSLPNGTWMAPDITGLQVALSGDGRLWRVDLVATEPVEVTELTFSAAQGRSGLLHDAAGP